MRKEFSHIQYSHTEYRVSSLASLFRIKYALSGRIHGWIGGSCNFLYFPMKHCLVTSILLTVYVSCRFFFVICKSRSNCVRIKHGSTVVFWIANSSVSIKILQKIFALFQSSFKNEERFEKTRFFVWAWMQKNML